MFHCTDTELCGLSTLVISYCENRVKSIELSLRKLGSEGIYCMLRFRTILQRSIKIIETIPELIRTCSRSVDRKAFFLGKQSTQ